MMQRKATLGIARCCSPALLLLFAALVQAQADAFERDRMKRILKNVSQEVERNFYDPQMRGLDWKALTEQASERIDKANSVGAMLTAIFALVEKLKDSHTFFIPPARPVTPLFGFEAKPFGDEIRIHKLKKGGAAAAGGLQLGDRLVSINGFRVERSSVDLMMLDFRHLWPVRLMEIAYSRNNEAPQKVRVEAKLKKEAITEDLRTLDSIYRYLQESGDEYGEREEVYASTASFAAGAIAYLKLKTFAISTDNADGLVERLQKSRAYIVDLRENTGGSVDALLAFANHFEEQPTTMGEIVRRKKTDKLELKPKRPILGGPLFILVDSHSMSASEMFARHFQRSGRAKIVGDRSPGRVNAAHIIPLETGTGVIVAYGVEVSVGRVVFPGGEQLEGLGVTPDVPCVPSEGDLRAERDTCRALALSLARKALGLPETGAAETEKKIEANRP